MSAPVGLQCSIAPVVGGADNQRTVAHRNTKLQRCQDTSSSHAILKQFVDDDVIGAVYNEFCKLPEIAAIRYMDTVMKCASIIMHYDLSIQSSTSYTITVSRRICEFRAQRSHQSDQSS